MGIASRSFSSGHFLLELGGDSAGYVRNLQGGGAAAEVVKEKVGTDHIVRKHIGGVSFDDIVLTCDAGASKSFYDWVGQSSGSQGVRRDGAVVVMEGGKEISRLDWRFGLISRVEFPALDATSKDLFSLMVKITPESTRNAKGGESRPVTPARKSWLASSFRLKIDGLEEACRHVSRIEPFAIDWRVKQHTRGEYLAPGIEPASDAEPGSLIVTLPESKAQGFQDWFEDFVIKGNSGQSNEKRGTLESGAFSLQFGNLGISRMTQPSGLPGAMTRKTVIEMYCESVRFSATSAA